MALTFTSAIASVVRHHYMVYMRETGTAIVAGDYDTAGHWATFLALFQHIGYCEDGQVKYKEAPNTVPIEYGKKQPVSYNGELDIKFIQNAKADFDAIEDMKDENCDLVIVDNVNHIFQYFHNKRFKVERNLVSGGIPSFNIQLVQHGAEITGSYATVYKYGTIPT